MKSLILQAIEELYNEHPFDATGLEYANILHRMQNLSRNRAVKLVLNARTKYYIKKKFNYFLRHIVPKKHPKLDCSEASEFISLEELSGAVFDLIDSAEDFSFSFSDFERNIQEGNTNTVRESLEKKDEDETRQDESQDETRLDEAYGKASLEFCGNHSDVRGNLRTEPLANGEDLCKLSCDDISKEAKENVKEISIDRFLNDSSTADKGTPENSFAVSVLKAIRHKYLTPEVCTHLNRKVRMVEGGKKNRKFNFKCSIPDSKMQISEVGEILNRNHTHFPLTKILEDFIRIAYTCKNNACDINFKNIRINQNSFVAYGYCTDLECNTFIFNGKYNGDVSVFRSQEEIIHTISKTNRFQCRGVQRYLAKAALYIDSALSYQKKMVNKQSDELRLIGKSQMIKSLPYLRNIKAESAAEHDRDPDAFIDTYLMFKTDYSYYIQHLSTKIEVFLWSKKQVSILRQHKDFIMKKINYTLHIDATGHVVDEMPFTTKRIFLYSVVGHIKEKNIVFSVADAILSNHTSYDIGRFFKALQLFCLSNKIKWPFCKRVVTDVSLAIIGAINKDINGVNSLLEYLNICYEIALNQNTERKKNNFVCIQFCVSHYSKIICKDIDRIVPLKQIKLRKFLREAFGIVFNLNQLPECIQWFEQLSIVLTTKKHTQKVNNALFIIKNAMHNSEIIYEFDGDSQKLPISQEEDNIGNISVNSPFRNLFQKYKSDIDNCDDFEASENIFFCPEIANLLLEKYIPFLPMWSNIIGSTIDKTEHQKRVSNGPIETYFKDIKYNILKGKKKRLGRFVRDLEKLSKYKTKQIKIVYNTIFTKPISPGVIIKPSEKKRSNKNKKKTNKILEIDSRKKLSKVAESWNKKLKRLPHGLFKNNFEMLKEPMEEFQTSKQIKISELGFDNNVDETKVLEIPNEESPFIGFDNNFDVTEIQEIPNEESPFIAFDNNVDITEILEIPNEESPFSEYVKIPEFLNKEYSIRETDICDGFTVLQSSDNKKTEKDNLEVSCEPLCSEIKQCCDNNNAEKKKVEVLYEPLCCDSELNYEVKQKSEPYKNLERFNFNDDNGLKFYLLKLEEVFIKVHGKHFALTSYITLTEIESLSGTSWLSTVIVDAAITCTMFENDVRDCLYIACQVGNTCFKNETLIRDSLARKPKKVIIPQCFQHHFYVVLIDFQKGDVLCLDPKGSSETRSRFACYYLAILKNIFPNINWGLKTVQHDIQHDGWNCGVFVIQFAERFIKSADYLNLQNLDAHRVTIKKMVYKHGDSLANICLHCAHDTSKSPRKLCCQSCFRTVCSMCKRYYKNCSSYNNMFFCKLCDG